VKSTPLVDAAAQTVERSFDPDLPRSWQQSQTAREKVRRQRRFDWVFWTPDRTQAPKYSEKQQAIILAVPLLW